MLLQQRAVKIFPDYHQFYLWDKGMNPSGPEEYSQEDVDKRIKVGPHVVVIQPDGDTAHVPVSIEIHDAEPSPDLQEWDHIAEASLNLPTGQLQVHECTGGPVDDFQVDKGWYRVRSFHGGLDSVHDGKSDAADFYRVALWPSPPDEVRIIKRYSEPA